MQEIETGSFAIDVTVRLPRSAKTTLFASVKGLLDGIASALHACTDPLPSELVARVAGQTRQTPDVVRSWLTRRGPYVLSNRSPVQPFGAGIKWHPDDDRCVAFSIVVERQGTGFDALMDWEVFAVQPTAVA